MSLARASVCDWKGVNVLRLAARAFAPSSDATLLHSAVVKNIRAAGRTRMTGGEFCDILCLRGDVISSPTKPVCWLFVVHSSCMIVERALRTESVEGLLTYARRRVRLAYLRE